MWNQHRYFIAILMGGCLTLPTSAMAGAWVAIDLGVDVQVQDVNDSGQVTGYYYPDSTDGVARSMAFVTGPEGVGRIDIGTLSGDQSFGEAVNNSGQVTGFYRTASGTDHAFVTGPNGRDARDVGTLGLLRSYGTDINQSGQVSGYVYSSDSTTGAFIGGGASGAVSELGTMGGLDSVASAINNSGQVVGTITDAAYVSHAFITGANGGTMTAVGTLAGTVQSAANDVNDGGQVVGAFIGSTPNSGWRAFITGPNGVGMREIDPSQPTFVDSEALGVNNLGQVVGYEILGGNYVAFVTGPNGVGRMNLSSIAGLGGNVLTRAYAINDLGEFVAIAGNGHAYLVTQDVPEPASCWLVAVGLLALVGQFSLVRLSRLH